MRSHILVLVSLVLLGASAAGSAVELLTTPPGRMVAVGDRHLHLNCSGHGEPTVVFESGLGGLGFEWADVQKLVGRTTRACSYDRAGYGFSEPGPMPRTAGAIADDLYVLLHGAGIDGPVVLVAHSFGGYPAQLYARAHPDGVAALILVDASNPAQLATYPVNGGAACEFVDRGVADLRFSITPHLPEGYPQEYGLTALALMMQPNAVRTQVSELCNFERSAKQIEAALPFPKIPLVVLSRSRAEFPQDASGRKLENAWRHYQDDLAHLTPGAWHVQANGAGHHVHLDRPDVVRDLAVVSVLLARQASEDARTRGVAAAP
ncbi:MAG: alpha/beta hydrolase [Gammaproteobacteria bacterium]|nr:alpha/beta hydrolase [Gammaproteobacteria bacterium]MBI5615201.1 alpha/beta hydrolase [Gammaproteobacteria bacterium]